MSEPKDKREAIMNSALGLFVTNGFDHTSTASISGDAGVGTGTLFTYFKNKDALINDLYLETKREFFEALPPISQDTLFNEEVARQMWDRSIAWGVKNPKKMKFMVMFKSSPYIAKVTRDEIGQEMKPLEEMYQHSIDAGLVKDLPLDYMLEATISHIYFTILYLISNKIEDPKIASKFFPTVWDIIRK